MLYIDQFIHSYCPSLGIGPLNLLGNLRSFSKNILLKPFSQDALRR